MKGEGYFDDGQLHSLVTQLISEFNQINELSRNATTEAAHALIAEFEATVS